MNSPDIESLISSSALSTSKLTEIMETTVLTDALRRKDDQVGQDTI